MKRRWMAWSMAVALALVPVARLAWAQEPRPETGPPPPEMGRGADLEGGAIDDDDDEGLGAGIDVLLAADTGDGPGEAMAGAMEPGPGMGLGGRRGPGVGRGPGGEELRARLNLSDDQRKRLADIRDRQAREAIPIQGDLRLAQLDMRKLIRADKPDLRAIEAQIDKVSALRARLEKSRVAHRLEARAVLTPAQQKIMREEGGRQRMAMMERRRMGGPGGWRMRMGR